MTEDTDDILRDIRRWVKIIGTQKAKSVMEEALSADDPKTEKELRVIYHLTNGENSTRDIAEHVSVSRQTVSNRQGGWSKMGLVEKDHPQAPYESIISLEEAGIEVPEVSDLEDES